MAGSRLAGSVAIVTGGGRGLGRVFAARLASEGAAVGLVARSAEQLNEVAHSLSANKVATAVADVTDEVALRQAIGEIEQALGATDLLVNNAGVLGEPGFAWDSDPDAWWRAMEINVRGVFLGCRIVIPTMIARGGGRIVNITSNAGIHRWPTMSAYSVSKAAVVKFSENLALECKSTGVRVWGLHPGLTAIGLTDEPHYRQAEAGSIAGNIRAWVEAEFEAGRGVDPSAGADLLVRVAAGDADSLSGCHLTVHDDLDALVANAETIRRNDFQTLRIKQLDPTL